MVNSEIHHRVETKILDTLLTLQSAYGRTFDIPKLVYKQIGRTAGRAFLSSWKIILNPDFLKNGHLEDMINRTLPHEIAHLVAYKLFGDHGHGRGWKMVMRALGLEPNRCHTYSLEGVRTRSRVKYESRCPVCNDSLLITAYRARQIQAGRIVYCAKTRMCRIMKKPLVLTDNQWVG